MRARDRYLMSEIERDVLDGNTSLADALRKCVVLGGKVGSTELREWASRELRGYQGEEETPLYRKPAAVLKVDAISGNTHITGQRVSPRQLPDFVAEHVGEEVPLREGIGEIEGLLAQARANGGSVKLSIPQGADVALYMDSQVGDPFQKILAIYWVLSESAMCGVLDRVRTTLAELVAEMRAGMPDSDDTPSAAVADHAVNVAVHGKRSRVTVTAARASGPGGHEVQAGGGADEGGSPWHRIGAALVGVATIIGVIIAFAHWQGWGV